MCQELCYILDMQKSTNFLLSYAIDKHRIRDDLG